MAAIQTHMTLKQHKHALLVESELNRLVLHLEIESLRVAAATGADTLCRIRSRAGWLTPLLGVAGIFAGNKLRKATRGRWLKIALVAAPLCLRLLRLRKPASGMADHDRTGASVQ